MTVTGADGAQVVITVDGTGRVTSTSRNFEVAGGGEVVPPPAVTLPTWVSNAPLNQWGVVPASNTLASLDPTTNPAITPAGADWVGAGLTTGGHAWTTYVWDDDSMTWFALMLGGHQDYGGNEPYAFDAGLEVPAWRRIRLPSGALPGPALIARDGKEADGTGRYADGALRAHHSYYNHIYVPGVGLIICRLTGLYFVPGGSDTRRVFTIDRNTGIATERCSYHDMVDMGTGEGAVAYDSYRDCLWTIGANASTLVQISNIRQPVWTATMRGGKDNRLKPSGAMDYVASADRLVLFPTFYGNGLGVIDPSNYSMVYPTVTGSFSPGYVPPDANGTQPGSGFSWCPELGCYLLWNNTSSTTHISTLSPTNLSDFSQPWVRGYLTPNPANSVTPLGSIPSGTFGRAVYAPKLGCILLHTLTNRTVLFYRLS